AVLAVYLGLVGACLALLLPALGRDLFPPVSASVLQLRLRAPTGTRIERTEVLTRQVVAAIAQEVGEGNTLLTLAFVGSPPPNYPINSIFLWTSGPHEAMLQVALRPGAVENVAALQERLRERLPALFPGLSVAFESGDIVGQIMNFGAPTPIEI